MKLIIQIPCFNEEEHLPLTLSELPRDVSGFDEVEYLVIDDGSSDATARVARESGAHHVLVLRAHAGLAAAFTAGLEECLRLGADVIVNTDADNQYVAADIPRLAAPILEGAAGMVIGIRPIAAIDHFSPVKKLLNRLGSAFVGGMAGMDIPDAPSGFRAISRDAAMRMNVFSDYTYTMESIIQARFKNIKVATVPIRVNPKLRESRLIRSIPSYIAQSVMVIFRMLLIYNARSVFMRLGVLFFLSGFLIGARFLYFFFHESGSGHIQSLVLLSVLFTLGLGSVLISVIADLLSVNRKLLEDIQYRLKKGELAEGGGASRDDRRG
ncbi:MAG: glycosyltransferase family 2 protein [Nitrospirae bacterium]|nr:glycosyltransferase family 2 protein [Nitrospirota bacterium]MBI5694212.1 glycosyltransferase family 2 protein [Nitrospirota bacterium]